MISWRRPNSKNTENEKGTIEAMVSAFAKQPPGRKMRVFDAKAAEEGRGFTIETGLIAGG